ncbi:hypothetical protein SK128_018233 [Halocaridina rubra]|uniref:Uncharacterized protein n=1 Tax=Halocaridina rubra TaxID=373956 RepID=A0AAN8X3S0_HALRR
MSMQNYKENIKEIRYDENYCHASSRGCQLLRVVFRILLLRVVFLLVCRLGIPCHIVEYLDHCLDTYHLRQFPYIVVASEFPVVWCCLIAVHHSDCDSFTFEDCESCSSCHQSHSFLWWQDAYS